MDKKTTVNPRESIEQQGGRAMPDATTIALRRRNLVFGAAQEIENIAQVMIDHKDRPCENPKDFVIHALLLRVRSLAGVVIDCIA